ncbi:hypothetical protein OWR29_46185 [Actinoplanes sp. Pm04-4]|uniref:Uncharacterized protein n=1 Tax=Paractinoplanes pyxinae TaxID=2997416 RepID=A0ABT4BFW9_9ACTN|nr:hypothetical protein [Actinoplanes pyxinae]MCY1145439.1 hypothetical protein [Actinoplanes pyxinae]
MVMAAVLTAILMIVAAVAVVARRPVPPAPTLLASKAQPPAADRTAGLIPQFVAGPRGSRAPPAATV